MVPQQKSLIFIICLVSLLICSAYTAMATQDGPGSFPLSSPVFLGNPNLEPGDYILWPGSGDRSSPGEKISYPHPVNTPDIGNTPTPVVSNPSPGERISYPDPVYQPQNPRPVNLPDIGNTPIPVVSNPSPGGRISYPNPCPNPTNIPFIPPTPTPRYCEPAPIRGMNPVIQPVYNNYPVYEEVPSRFRYKYDDRDFYSSFHHSSDWYRTGSIQVISTPTRAEVYLNSKYRGKIPYSGYLEISDLVPGTYELRVQYSGYVPYSRIVQVERDEVETIPVVLTRIQEEVPAESSIQISSEPAGANVLLDNEYRGISPVTLHNLVSGEHTLTLQKTGYTDFVTKVQAVQGVTLPVTGVMMIIPPQPTVPPTPVQTPLPAATYAGLPIELVIISLVAGILICVPVRRWWSGLIGSEKFPVSFCNTGLLQIGLFLLISSILHTLGFFNYRAVNPDLLCVISIKPWICTDLWTMR